MSEPTLLSQVAELSRSVSKDVVNGREKLCLSTGYLKKLNSVFDENVPEDLAFSFQLTDAKATLQREFQLVLDLVKGTVALKVTPDPIENADTRIVSLKRFKNIKNLEVQKVDVRNILGIQKLRSQIQELTCMYNLGSLSDIMVKCGGDLSGPNLWSELKSVNFSHNRISDIDASLESTPWLNTLDLSYNQLTNVEFINNLPNLKNLNISYNKLEKVPKFTGPVCRRLQILLLNNNFIEDLSGLYSLTNLSQLDLSQNCLLDHTCFMSISHMSSLYFLNIQGNPLNFHPQHRTITCNYLNKNTASLNVVLDNIHLNKSEKLLAGSLYPVSKNSLSSSYDSSQNSFKKDNPERPRSVRTVEIHEGHDVVVEKAIVLDSKPKINNQYLEIKNKIEQLRQDLGDKWLSSKQFKEVLCFPISPTRLLDEIQIEECCQGNVSVGDESNNPENMPYGTEKIKIVPDESNEIDGCSLLEPRVNSIFDDIDEQRKKTKSLSDDDDVDGESFFASSVPESEDYDLIIIVTDTHLYERDSVSYEKKERWHINVVKSCQRGDKPNEVLLVFDIFRRDRKLRTYYMEEADEFVKMIFERMMKNKVPDKRTQYQCIKCNELFSKIKIGGFLSKETVSCPKCNSSNMIIECK